MKHIIFVLLFAPVIAWGQVSPENRPQVSPADSMTFYTIVNGQIFQIRIDSLKDYINLTPISEESTQDFAGALFNSSVDTLITSTYDDANGKVNLVVEDSLSKYTNDANFITTESQTLSFTNPNLSISGGNSIDLSSLTGTTLSQEEVEDFTGGLFTGNTESLITSTYDDTNGKVGLTVNPNLSNYTNDAGFLTSEVDGSTSNEIQTLSFSSNTLSISSGNSVDLSSLAGGVATATISDILGNGNDAGGTAITGTPKPTTDSSQVVNLDYFRENGKDFTIYADHLDRIKILEGGKVVISGQVDFVSDGLRHRFIPTSSPDTFTLANNQYLALDLTGGRTLGVDREYDESDILTTYVRNASYLYLAQYSEDNFASYNDWTGKVARQWDNFLVRNANEQLKARYHEGRVTFNSTYTAVTINGDIELTNRDGKAIVISWSSYPQTLDPPSGQGYVLDLTETPTSSTSQRVTYDGATAVKANDEAVNESPNYKKIWLVLERCRDCGVIGAGLLFEAYGAFSLTELTRNEPWFIRNTHLDRVTLDETGSAGQITFSNDIDLVYPGGYITIDFSTVPYTTTLANLQYLYLDVSSPNSTGNPLTFDENDLGKSYTSGTGNRIPLVQWTEDKQFPFRWNGPLYEQTKQKLEIQAAGETNFQMRYIEGRVTFSDDLSECYINGDLEFGVRDANWIRLQFPSYPQTVTVDGGDIYVLNLSSTKDAASDFRFDIYNWSEAVDTVADFSLTDVNSTTIPLLGEHILDAGLKFGHGLIFETYYDPTKIERLKTRGDIMAVQAELVSDTKNKLAHDHNIQIVKSGTTLEAFRVISYQYNNTVETEISNFQHVKGKLYNYYTNELLVDTILLAPNTTYTNITTADERCGHPHSYQINDSIVITALNNGIGLYKTELNLNQKEWSNLDYFQCSFGSGQVDVDTAVVKTYLRNTLGFSSSVVNPHNKLRLRNADQIQQNDGGTEWYALIDLYEEPSADPGSTSIAILIYSTDDGATWTARGAPYAESIYPNGLSENALVQLNDTLYSVGRGSGAYLLSKSSDFGVTWSTPSTITGLGLGTSSSVHKYVDVNDNSEWAIFAYNSANSITGHRTRMIISKTQDFQTFYTMAIYDAVESAHYPSIDLQSGFIHVTWTSGVKVSHNGVYDYDESTNGRDGVWYSKAPLRWFYDSTR